MKTHLSKYLNTLQKATAVCFLPERIGVEGQDGKEVPGFSFATGPVQVRAYVAVVLTDFPVRSLTFHLPT